MVNNLVDMIRVGCIDVKARVIPGVGGQVDHNVHGTVGDLVVWDNLATLHTASLFDHTRHQRLMFRTTVSG